MQRHTPMYPGAMTPAEADYRFLCGLIKVATGATATIILTAIMLWLS